MKLAIAYTAKHLRRKTFIVGIEKYGVHRKTFAVAASFNNESLWLLNYLS